MLKEIIEHIDSKLTYISKAYGIAELVNVNGDIRPEVYTSNGDFVEVADFDNHKGVSYWRLTGDVAQDAERDPYRGGNKIVYERTYPLRFVVCLSRKDLPNDNQWTADYFANKIIKDIDNFSATVKNSLNIIRGDLLISNYSWNRQEIVQEEFNENIRLRHEYMILAFDINLNVRFGQNCLIDFCGS